jgi:hypothetical protein
VMRSVPQVADSDGHVAVVDCRPGSIVSLLILTRY